MNILCTICSDLVSSAESVCVTKCGHIFHHHCLAQWNERSKTCPQCRHAVTSKCLFRIYPTISNDTLDSTVTLQSRLDDAKLTTRQQTLKITELETKIANLTADLKKNEKILHETEKKLVKKGSAVCALKEQLDYVKLQNKECTSLKQENSELKRNIETLSGLQKVLNATTEEVEKMLQSYSDVHTIATFAAALKRALWESENRKNETRDRLWKKEQSLSKVIKENKEWQLKYRAASDKLLEMEEKMKKAEEMHNKLKAIRESEATKQKLKPIEASSIDNTLKENKMAEKKWRASVHKFERQLETCNEEQEMDLDLDTTFLDCTEEPVEKVQISMVARIQNSDSPYLALKQSTLLPLSAIARKKMLPLSKQCAACKSAVNTAHIKPSTSKENNLDVSIFNQKHTTNITDMLHTMQKSNTENDILYDGLGGHSKLDKFPVKSPLKSKSKPVLTAKHKLKRPMPSGSQDISSFVKRMKD